jgi:hypothetical protein
MAIQFQVRGAKSRVINLINDVQPTQGDLVSAALLHRNRVLDRTARGVDLDERAFADYSDVGPIYIDLGSKVGAGRTVAQKVSAAKRFSKKVGLGAKVFKRGPIAVAKKRANSQKAAKRNPAAGFRLIQGVTPIGGITPGGLLKVASYKAFKLQILGRSVVDLFGHRAPHMLQSLLVRFGGSQIAGTIAPRAYPQQPTSVEMGLFGEEASRGLGHNVGAGALPARRWFGVGRDDLRVFLDHIANRMMARGQLKRSA